MRYIILFLLFVLSVFNVEAKTLRFMEKTDKKCVEILWTITTEKYWTILDNKRLDNSSISTNDLSLNTLEWQLRNDQEKTNIVAKRKKNSIVVKGLFKGKNIQREIKIDKDPWYQPMSLSLSRFSQSDKKTVTFWTLNPLDFRPYKIKALNYGVDTLTCTGKKVQTRKVKVILTGFRSLFWHAFYWFRQDDGTLLQYEGVDGPPTTPVTTITLIDETD